MKEIIIGKIQRGARFLFCEIPFFVSDIRQLCFNPYEESKYKYSVIIYPEFTNQHKTIYISKEQYEYLQEKLGANDDDEWQRISWEL